MQLAKIGQPLIKTAVIELGLSLMEGTTLKEEIIQWKKDCKCWKEGQDILGSSWYQNFMQQNKNHITRSKANFRDVNRLEWTTYDNFKAMYDSVYKQMVEAGVARKLDQPVLMDKAGNIVEKKRMHLDCRLST